MYLIIILTVAYVWKSYVPPIYSSYWECVSNFLMYFPIIYTYF